MIEIEALGFHHGRSRILEDVGFAIPAGGITALVGPNGAGKSTLLGLMGRLIPLQDGSIRIDGRSIADYRNRDFARLVSVLRQETTVAGRLTVSDIVGFGRFPHSRGRLTDRDRAVIADAIDRFQLGDLAGRNLETLSGGQRQRAFVAMSYCQGCPVMLLDEPLNSLDMFHARELMRMLRAIAAEEGRTIVIVLHDINHAAAHSDRIVALRDGRLVACAPTKELMSTQKLAEIYGYEMRVIDVDTVPVVLHHR